MGKEIRYQDKPWLNQYEKGVSEKIEFEEIFLHEFLERSAGKSPDKTALIFQGYKVTYRELNDMANRFAACLIDFGIDKGDSVAILLPNVIPCVVSYYAILKIGGIVVMNNPLYSDRELNHQFNDAGAKALITLDLLANRMINLRPETKIRQIFYTSIGDYLPFPKNLLFKFVAKKKKPAADVNPSKDVYRWKEKKDMIISGGLNVYPRDIEEVFYENSKVQEACCIGIPHPTRGEAAKVFLVLKENEIATARELIEFCKPRLARYKLPTEIEFRKELPKTSVGKVARKDLKAEAMKVGLS